MQQKCQHVMKLSEDHDGRSFDVLSLRLHYNILKNAIGIKLVANIML